MPIARIECVCVSVCVCVCVCVRAFSIDLQVVRGERQIRMDEISS